MNLDSIFEALKENKVRMPQGGFRTPEAFTQRANYGTAKPFVPPNPWPRSQPQAQQHQQSHFHSTNTNSSSTTQVTPTPVMEDYMRQLTQAIMTDPTGKKAAEIGQLLAQEALNVAGLSSPMGMNMTPGTTHTTVTVNPPPPPRPTTTSAPKTRAPVPSATPVPTTTPVPDPVATPVLESAPAPVPARFALHAEAVRVGNHLTQPVPEPSTPTTTFWNYMQELAEYIDARIYVRVCPLFARCIGSTKRHILIIDATTAEVLHPRGSFDDALTYLHEHDLDIEYTSTTLKKYKVPEVHGIAKRYNVDVVHAETGKKKNKDIIIAEIIAASESMASIFH